MNLNIIHSTVYNLMDVGFGKFIYIFCEKPTLLICKWMYFISIVFWKFYQVCVQYSNTIHHLPPSSPSLKLLPTQNIILFVYDEVDFYKRQSEVCVGFVCCFHVCLVKLIFWFFFCFVLFFVFCKINMHRYKRYPQSKSNQHSWGKQPTFLRKARTEPWENIHSYTFFKKKICFEMNKKIVPFVSNTISFTYVLWTVRYIHENKYKFIDLFPFIIKGSQTYIICIFICIMFI